jgi:anti-sigma factor ChrR (cupin superfamily)
MQLIRFAAGASFPLHKHLGPEFIYLLEGTAIQEGKSLSTGWSARCPYRDNRFKLPQSDGLRLSDCLLRLK